MILLIFVHPLFAYAKQRYPGVADTSNNGYWTINMFFILHAFVDKSSTIVKKTRNISSIISRDVYSILHPY